MKINRLASHVTAYPVLPMRLDADSFDVQVLGPSASTTNLSFTTDALFEPIPAYAGALSLGLPLLESKHNWRAKPTRQTSFSANSFDAGNVATWELRYRKASVSVSFDLWGRAEILAFRLFIRQLRGRYQQFRWVAFDGVERTYRLTSDVWELSYTGTHTASCALRFTEI